MDKKQINALRKSNWNVWIGIAAEDKTLNSNVLKIYVPEILPNMDGGVGDYTGKEACNIYDSKSEKKMSSSVKTTNVLTATYFNLSPNRSDIPNIRKGEEVWVLQYSDTDIYKWYPTAQFDHYRRLDTYRVAISGVSDKDVTCNTSSDEDVYMIEMDTLTKKAITISTSKKDEEKFRYIIKLDSEANTVTIMDDDGNEILLDSNVPRIRLLNKSKTFVDLNDKDLLLCAPQDITMKAGRQVLIKSPVGTINFDKTGSISGEGLVMSGDNVSFNGNTLGLNGAVKAESIVSGPIQSSGVSGGEYTEGYPKPSTDLTEGAGNNPAATPAVPSDAGNRHAAAQEQLHQALQIIQDSLNEIDGKIGLSTGYSQIVPLSSQSLMPNTKGE
jgi:hypothetical protein